MKKRKLSFKQRRFVEEYCLDWNGTKAAVRAGYSPKTASVIASQSLRKVNILAEIERAKENLEELAGISKLRLVKELTKIAYSSISQLHDTWIDRKAFDQLTDDQKSTISEIETRVIKRNNGTSEDPEIVDIEQVRVKLYDKIKAISEISRLMGYDATKKVDIKLERMLSNMDETKLIELAEEILRLQQDKNK